MSINLRRARRARSIKLPKRNKTAEWETKDGEVISVYKMTDSHLQNSINMMSRQIWKDEESIEYDEDGYIDIYASNDKNRRNKQLKQAIHVLKQEQLWRKKYYASLKDDDDE